MNTPFQRIGILAKADSTGVQETLLCLLSELQQFDCDISLAASTSEWFQEVKLTACADEDLGNNNDLVIVVGGDGMLLRAARLVVGSNTPVLGINRGYLGFLTDIHPTELCSRLGKVLQGDYIEESRFLLHSQIDNKELGLSLNDVVLNSGGVVHMITFDTFVNDEYVNSHRADGLIVATPTGSTAYSLSGGGPILHPQLNALLLLPMFSHTLSSRPLVIDSNSTVRIEIKSDNKHTPHVSCDGQDLIPCPPGSSITINQHDAALRLIHPSDYNYFATLQTKLHWSMG